MPLALGTALRAALSEAVLLWGPGQGGRKQRSLVAGVLGDPEDWQVPAHGPALARGTASLKRAGPEPQGPLPTLLQGPKWTTGVEPCLGPAERKKRSSGSGSFRNLLECGSIHLGD